MMSSTRRIRAAIALAIGVLICTLALAGPAVAAGSSSSAYPPGTSSTSSSSGAGVAGVAASPASNGNGAKNVNSSGSSSGLASTGFQAAAATIVVAGLLGTGLLCLFAGRRRRHT